MPRIRLHRIVIFLLAFFIGVPVSAQSGNPPPADQVFSLTASRSTEGGLQLDWRIAPGDYLYRDKIAVKTAGGAAVAVTTPPGQIKDDPTFGTTEVYHDHVQADVAAADLPATGQAVVAYQGCAERGICYPPVRKRIDLAAMTVTNGAAADPLQDIEAAVPDQSPVGSPANVSASGDGISATTRLLSGHVLAMLAAFFGFGLLLSFTPCVFPMIPILSGILARSGEHLSAKRGFVLSAAYVLAMALAYAALGVAAAWSGQNLQIALQTPLALGAISLVFVALALSMFGLYDLQLPARWIGRLSGGAVGNDRWSGAARLRLGADRWAVRDAAARGRAALCGPGRRSCARRLRAVRAGAGYGCAAAGLRDVRSWPVAEVRSMACPHQACLWISLHRHGGPDAFPYRS